MRSSVTSRRRLVSPTDVPGQSTVLDISPEGNTLLITQPTTDGPQALVALHWGGSVLRQLQGREN